MSPPPRVVLVDDTEDLRQLLRIALGRAGWEVVGEAGDGAAGIEVVREQDPDLVVLDLSMPVMDGLEALPHIRAACPQATIVVMSGFGAGQMGDRAMAVGADGYLQKGEPLSTVVASLADAMARRDPAQARVREVAPAEVVQALVARRHDAAVVVEDDRLVLADPLQLEQIVGNLLANAGTHGRPPVTVTIRPAGDRVAIDVADHGDGLPESVRALVFDGLGGARPATDTGLHVVRALAEAQGGAASYAPGPSGGAVFTVELPAA